MARIRSYRELHVYQNEFDAAMMIFELTKSFPVEEKYSLVDRIRRSSRSVCTNIAEAWRKRKYPAHFVSKLSDSAGEGDGTRGWLEVSIACKYISSDIFEDLDSRYDIILAQLVTMMSGPGDWQIS